MGWLWERAPASVYGGHRRIVYGGVEILKSLPVTKELGTSSRTFCDAQLTQMRDANFPWNVIAEIYLDISWFCKFSLLHPIIRSISTLGRDSWAPDKGACRAFPTRDINIQKFYRILSQTHETDISAHFHVKFIRVCTYGNTNQNEILQLSRVNILWSVYENSCLILQNDLRRSLIEVRGCERRSKIGGGFAEFA